MLGGIVAFNLLDYWTNFGVSWGPELTPVAHADTPPLAVNVFLDKEPDPANVDKTLQMVHAGGFRMIRQAFPWFDIEISAKGNYTDTRFGRETSAWAKYDYIVNQAAGLGLDVLARIDAPPGWAHADGRVSHDPPANYSDFADFVGTLVARYRGKVRYFQLWNEPNLAGEWAGRPDATEYTRLLRAADQAAKHANPAAVILMAPLAPTAERGPANISDLIFLQQMYDAGAKDAFDVANVMVYGLGYPPEDRRTAFDRLNFSRPILTRQIMERNGDGGKAVWASEYAWISLPPDWPGKPSTWGRSVDEATQGRYLVDGLRRARAEWPWMGPMFVWNFRDPEPLPNEPATYFQIVNNDFTPRPAYTALQEYSRQQPLAETGAHGVSSPALSLQPPWTGDAPTLTASRIVTATTPDDAATIHFQGNRLDLLLGAPDHPTRIQFVLDGGAAQAIVPTASESNGAGFQHDAWWTDHLQTPIWRFTLAQGLAADASHTLTFHTETAPDTLALAGFIVSRTPPPGWVWPFVYGVLTLLLAWIIGRLLSNLFAIPSALLGRRSVGAPGGRSSGAGDSPRGRPPDAPTNPPSSLVSRITYHVSHLPTPVALALLLIFFAAYYWSPWTVGAGIALAAWGVVAVLRPDLALAFTAALFPFLFQPRTLGEWHFAPAETALLITFAAVVGRRTLRILSPNSSFILENMSLTPNPQPPTPNLLSTLRNWLGGDNFVAPALALIAVGTLSLLTVADWGYLRNSLREYRWTIVEPVLFYFLATEVLRGRRGAWRLADGLVIGGVAAATGALIFAVLGQSLDVEGVLRVYWPYLHPNNLALYMGRVAPLAACVALFLTPTADGWRRRLYALACVPLFVALWLTFSRGAYLGLFAAALVVAGLAGWRRAALALGGVGIAGAGALLLNALVPFLPERAGSLGSTVLRLGVWQAALQMLADHPLFGIGLDQFLGLYPRYMNEANAYEAYDSHPHNLLLDIWLRLGIIGLLVLGWVAARFVRLVRPLVRGADPTRRALALGLVALLIDSIVHGLVDNVYFVMDLALAFWAACTLLQLLHDDYTTETQRTVNRGQ